LALDRLRLGVAVALVAACGLTACGRAGALDPPPSDAAVPVTPQAALPPPATSGLFPHTSTAESQATAQKTGFDSRGSPIAPPGEKKSFFLDFLLN